MADKWIAGTVGLTWTSAGFGTEVNSLASGNAVIAATQLDNSANLDKLCDLSMSLGSVTTGAGAPFIAMYLMLLNQDGTSYADGRFGTSAAGPPPSTYWVGNAPTLVSTAGIITGSIRGILMPPGKFKFLIYNQAGVALAASSNTISFRTYD